MNSQYLRLVAWATGLSCLLPMLVALTTILHSKQPLGWDVAIDLGALLIGALVVMGLLRLFWSRTHETFRGLSFQQAHFLDTLPEMDVPLALLVAAGLSLFLELAVIRWLATVYPFFSFYKNFTLLACFAGLGLGYAMARDTEIGLPVVLPFIAWQLLVILFARYGMDSKYTDMVMWLIPFTEQFHMGIMPSLWTLLFVPVHMFLGIVFFMTSIAFVPIGQLCGRLMRRLPTLRAYGINLLGSLLGVVIIFLTSYLWLPPVAWFALAFCAILVFTIFDKRLIVIGVVAAALGVTALSYPCIPDIHRIFSPYQSVERNSHAYGWMSIDTAGFFHQNVLDLSFENANRGSRPDLVQLANYYEFPYLVHASPDKVAIVGSGTGNDAAAALRMGHGLVYAVEIDPVILRLGETNHPERPYSNKRVIPVVSDARAFFRTTQEKFDVIVYGLLDSHTLLSQASSVRLDSFVYTVEGLREARAKLKENGTLCLSFFVISPEIGRKFYMMMKQAFDGLEPLCIKANIGSYVTFVQGRDRRPTVSSELLGKLGFYDTTAVFAQDHLKADVSTDDWPFVYMPVRRYPWSYLPMAVMVLALTFLESRLLLKTAIPFRLDNVVFFLLGAGFMLIETKAITELGLTFGNTWQVIGIAVAGILAMAYLANLAVERLRLNRVIPAYVMLLACLVFGYLVASWGGLSSDLVGRIGTTVILTCPLFFSGIVFSSILQHREDVTSVMASNLLGAMIGGLLEYHSMYYGFGFLYLLAIGIYGLACAFWFISSQRRASEI